MALPPDLEIWGIDSGVRLWNGRGRVISLDGSSYPSMTGFTFATNDAAYIASVFDAPGVLGLTNYAPPREFGFTVEVVDGRSDEFLPAVRTFDLHDPSARSLWYNRTNGSVCARVVDDGEPASVELRFARANGESRVP